MSPQTKITTCIIPAAGKGSRWAPVSGYLPKEMLPLIDRPVIEWVIEEVKASGCQHIIVVINKQKQIIKNYISKNKALNKKLKIEFVYQETPLGIGHALYLCKKKIGDNPFAVALPDLPTICKKPAMKQLMEAFAATKGHSNIVSFDKFSSESLHLYGECSLHSREDKLLEIVHFCPKDTVNQKPHHPGNKLRMSGRFIFKTNIFPLIKKLLQEQTDAEITDRSSLGEALKKGETIIGCQLQGHTYDTGTPVLYVHANTAFFKKKLTKN